MASIFISHSSQDRDVVKSQIAEWLHRQGIEPWYSEDAIHGAEQWEKRIKEGLQQCDWFMVVLSRHSVHSEWVQAEVHWALEHRRGRVIPVLIDECDPAECHLMLRQIQYINFRKDFHSAQQQLVRILQDELRARDRPGKDHPKKESAPNSTPTLQGVRDQRQPLMRGLNRYASRSVFVVVATAVAAIGLGGAFLQFVFYASSGDSNASLERADSGGAEDASSYQSTDSQPKQPPNGDLAEVMLTGGKLLFRTERLEPVMQSRHVGQPTSVRPSAWVHVLGDKSSVHELELAFQLVNNSESLVTLASLAVAELGVVTVYEDADPVRSYGPDANYELSVIPERTDLGVLEFLWHGTDSEPSTSSGSLLPAKRLEAIEPRSVRSFKLGLHCRKEGPDVHYRNVGSSSDVSRTLASLDQRRPEIVALAHIVVIKVECLTGDGTRHVLYSDQVYGLEPGAPVERLKVRALTEEVPSHMPLSRWYGIRPTEFVSHILGWSVKTFRETLAYKIAEASGELPDNFDADTVSAHCYSRDIDSPLRATAKPRAREWLIMPTARSNIVDVLARVRVDHPALWQVIDQRLQALDLVKQDALSEKARFVRRELQARHP